MRPLRRPAALAVFASLALLGACSDEAPPPEPVVRPVKMVEFAAISGTTEIDYPGRVQAAERSELAFEVAGRIVEFPVHEGQEIAKGTVIAKLEPRDFRSRVDAEKAHAAAMRAEFERMKELFDANVASKQQYDKAVRDYEVAKARVDTAEKAMEDAVLRAPFDAIVGQKLVDDFAAVQTKQPVVSLQGQSRDFEVLVDLPEQDALRVGRQSGSGESIEERTRATVEFASIPGRRFTLRVKEFAAKADPVTRTFRVTASFEAPEDLNVMEGMTAKVRVEVPNDSALAHTRSLPVQAVLADNQDRPYVWVVDPDTSEVEKRTVEVGNLFHDRIEVKGNLDPGELVVVSGVLQMREGLPVRRLEE
jgi:RND family efflux transporter MFP subunit